MAGPFGERGVVGEIVAAGRAARRCAARNASKSNACGVCTARSRLRSSVSITIAARIDLLEGVGDGDGREPRRRLCAGGDRARDQGAGQERPGGVVDEDDAGCAGSSASSPARTEACRVAPPNTGSHRLCRPAVAARNGRRRRGWITGCTRPIRGCAANSATYGGSPARRRSCDIAWVFRRQRACRARPRRPPPQLCRHEARLRSDFGMTLAHVRPMCEWRPRSCANPAEHLSVHCT